MEFDLDALAREIERVHAAIELAEHLFCGDHEEPWQLGVTMRCDRLRFQLMWRPASSGAQGSRIKGCFHLVRRKRRRAQPLARGVAEGVRDRGRNYGG